MFPRMSALIGAKNAPESNTNGNVIASINSLIGSKNNINAANGKPIMLNRSKINLNGVLNRFNSDNPFINNGAANIKSRIRFLNGINPGSDNRTNAPISINNLKPSSNIAGIPINNPRNGINPADNNAVTGARIAGRITPLLNLNNNFNGSNANLAIPKLINASGNVRIFVNNGNPNIPNTFKPICTIGNNSNVVRIGNPRPSTSFNTLSNEIGVLINPGPGINNPLIRSRGNLESGPRISLSTSANLKP